MAASSLIVRRGPRYVATAIRNGKRYADTVMKKLKEFKQRPCRICIRLDHLKPAH
jgi:hypothetical protein